MNRLRLKLVAILALVALLPAIPAAWAARELLERVWAPLKDPVMSDGIDAGLDATRELLEVERHAFADAIADPRRVASFRRLDADEVTALPPRERGGLTELAVGAAPERRVVDGAECLVTRDSGGWLVHPLPDDLVRRVSRLTESATRLNSLRVGERDLVRSVVAAFLAVYGVTLIAVLGGGLLLASRLTRPLSALGRGIEAVSRGDLSPDVPMSGAPEIQRLLRGFVDMTRGLREQRAQRRRLEKIEAWRQMARRLAHEVKNPLTPIQLAAEQMRDAYPGNDPAYTELLSDATGIIEEEVRSLRDLVTEFSHFARLPKPSLDAVPVRDIVGDLTALYRDEQVRVDGDLSGIVWGDRPQIHRVFINLINNALDAQRGLTDEPVLVSVGASPRETMPVEITIRDHGPGIDDDQMERVFEPDFTTKSDGMGLGLAIVQAIVNGHRGDIFVQTPDGGGAAFHTLWPDRPEEAA